MAAESARLRTILDRMEALHPKRIDLTLGRVVDLLEKLGRPERRLAPVVHIAGTNGKGSTLAMLDAMLQAQGLRTQRYVSPHLVRFNERILLDGAPIADAPLIDVLARAERANDGASITFFEITTAAAFLAFAEHDADILLLETGLGGRLDATNLVERPALSLISPISIDHEAFLGAGVANIAREKAGIFRKRGRAISGPQSALAAEVLDAEARRIGADLALHGRDWTFERAGDGVTLALDGARLPLPKPGLIGRHQGGNAALAAAAALSLPDTLRPSVAAIQKGVRDATWPARMQRLREGPYFSLLGAEDELWLDGGHNEAAGAALGDALRDLAPEMDLVVVLGMLRNKDPKAYLQGVAALKPRVRAIDGPSGHDGWRAAEIAAIARGLGLDAHAHKDARAALAADRAAGDAPLRAVLCGSLYLAGEILAAHR